MAPLHLAFLRGINVGGRHRLPMADLRGLFEQAGAQEVETLIQSGNVLFEAPAKGAAKLVRQVQQAIVEAHGFEAPVVLRRPAPVQQALEEHPFAELGLDGSKVAVGFLAGRPKAGWQERLDPGRFAPDRVELVGQEVFLAYPNGQARTRLTGDALDRAFGTSCTVRNVKTLGRVLAKAAERGYSR